MSEIKLIRTNTSKLGTTGVLLGVNAEVLAATLECPDEQNAPFISCIPEGTYTLAPYSSKKYTDVFQLLDVPNRTYILIHAGNTVDDTQGCILVGNSHASSSINSIWLGSSRIALRDLRAYITKYRVNRIEVGSVYGR